MKRLKEIIRNLGLKDNEIIIITEDEYKLLKQVETSATKNSITNKKQHRKNTKKSRGRKPAEIIWTDTQGKGQIRKRAGGELVFYYYDKNNKRPYAKKGTYEELVQFGKYFEKTGYNKDKFYNKKHNGSISKMSNGSYILRKKINKEQKYFGGYSDKRLAEEVQVYLEFKNWDLDYEPKNLTPATIKRLGVDEYYRTMKPIMSADKEFQNYKIMKGVLI